MQDPIRPYTATAKAKATATARATAPNSSISSNSNSHRTQDILRLDLPKTRFIGRDGPYLGSFLGLMAHFWGHFLGSFFGHFWVHFLDHFLVLEYVNNRFNRLKNVCIRSYKASWGLIRPYKVTLWTHLGLSWAVFGAILRNLIQSWAILGSFWDRFWAILNNFEAILGTSSNFEKSAQRTLGRTDFFPCRLKDAPCETPVFKMVKKRPSKFLNPLRGTLDTHFGTPFWEQICTRSSQDEPKRPIRSFKTKKQPFQNP